MLRIGALCMATILGTGYCSLWAQTPVGCPPLPNQLSARAEVTTGYDAKSRLYTYRYTVANDAMSRQELKYFVVEAAEPVSAIKSPTHWTPVRFGPNLLGWRASGEDKAREHPWGAAPSLGQIRPGQSQAGFEFRSPNPPGNARMFVRGYSGRSFYAGEAQAERDSADCPEPSGDFFELAVEGSTVAPVAGANGKAASRLRNAAAAQ